MTFEELLADSRLKSALWINVPTPLYHQVYLYLKEKIHHGDIVHGEKMPTEHQISEAFAVSRITAKRAMDELAAEGYVTRQRGKGSHVAYKHEAQHLQASQTTQLESLKVMEHDTIIKSLTFDKLIPPLDIQQRFGIGPTDSLIKSVRLHYANHKPFGYFVSWTRDIGEFYNEDNLVKMSPIDLFRKMDIALDRVQQSLTATLSAHDTGAHLEVPVGRPLLVLDRSIYDDKGQLIDHMYALYRPDQYQFEMQFSMT